MASSQGRMRWNVPLSAGRLYLDEGRKSPLRRATRARLADYGKKSETFDQIVVRLLDEVEKKNKI